jgi:hypothetical protein
MARVKPPDRPNLVSTMRGNRPQVAGRTGAGRVFRAAVVVLVGLVSGFALYVLLVGLGVLPKFYPAASGDLALARGDRAGLRVLFVGNSITYTNDMPALVHELAAADPGARPIFAVKYTAGGWRLKLAAEDEGLAALLKEVPWDVVVLQEHSRVASLPDDQRRLEMDPYVRALHVKIERAGARTFLFLPYGGRRVGGGSYEAEQSRLWYGYSDLALQLPATVVPVGLAWGEALGRQPGLDLLGWSGHPNQLGSYLTACVFYAVLSHRDPTGSRFTAGIESAEAQYLQYNASNVVARNLAMDFGTSDP